MKHKASKKKGFTLVELMITVGIVAILVALALPSYTQYIRKANRGEAQQLLMNWANNQEIWRANNPAYADQSDLPPPTHDKYTFPNPTVSATTFLLTAEPEVGQDKDKNLGLLCGDLTLDQSNVKGPSHCW